MADYVDPKSQLSQEHGVSICVSKCVSEADIRSSDLRGCHKPNYHLVQTDKRHGPSLGRDMLYLWRIVS